ncbi:MAG TPA: hypothetical protein PLR99_19455, partial [Polyangiaceae bacterium]|nr:hypothetical protein [Polyangiaceae bacterium]
GAALCLASVLAFAVAGCRGSAPVSAGPVGASTPKARPTVPPRRPTGKARGNLIATVGDRSVGPFLARRDGSAMAAFLGFGEDGVRRVSVIPLTAQGELRSGVRGLVPTPFDSADLAISATQGPDSGYAVLFSALTDRGKGLWAFGVTEEGALRGPAAEITRTTSDIVWSDLVPTPRGALALWVDQSVEQAVDQAGQGEGGLYAASLDPAGKLRGVPVRLVKGVIGWQVVGAGAQVQVAVVHARPAAEAPPEPGKSPEPKKNPEPPPPAISLMTLDADARIERAVPVAASAAVRGALEVARERGRTHVVWTDTSGTEPEVLAVTVDDQRGASPPRRVADTRDGTVLVALAGGESGVAVAWERDVPEARDRRFVQLARLTDAPARRVTRLEVARKSRVELASAPDGFAVLASLRACSFDPRAEPGCAVAPFEPALLRADRDGAPLDVTPLEFGDDPPGLAWALGCPSGCLALSAAGASPARVRTAFVAARTTPAAPLRDPTPTAPLESRMLDIETLSTGEAVAKLAHLKLGNTVLVASLSAEFELPGRATRAAVVRVRAYDEHGRALFTDAPPAKATRAAKDPTVLSSRALAVGGLAIAPAGRPEDGGAVAWVGRQGAEPQVHITRIDARGRRTNEIVLTSSRGGATDVALAWVGDAWIVGWVDFRDGNGEVYATKITPDLKRVVREERVTRAPGDASGLQLLAAGRDRVFAAWSDAREAPREGFADIYLTQLRAHDATRLTEELRLLPSVPHSRSPELIPAVGGGAGAIVAWIEQAPEGADPSRGGAYRALALRVDGQGKPVGVPVSLPVAGPGHPTALSLEVTPDGVRGVIARAQGAGVTLDGVRGNFGSFAAVSLGGVATPASSDVALLAFDGWVYFGEDGAAAHERRLRRAHVPR